MKVKTLLPLLAAALLVSRHAEADLDVGTLRQLDSDPQYQAYVLGYFRGLKDGVSWSNTKSESLGKPIYCPPGNFPLTAETAKSFVLNAHDTWIIDASPVPLVLLNELIKAFPCKR